MNKPIKLTQPHLSTLQNQAYFIRDKLIDAHIIYKSDIDEDKWLLIFAKSLNHQDWEQLKFSAKNGNPSEDQIIFSEQTIVPIALKLKSVLGRPDLDTEALLCILYNACTDSELKAMGETADSIPPLPQAPNSYILELGPNFKYANKLLEWLWPINCMSVSRIQKLYNEHIKKARKGLSRAEVKERHLDVYPKSGIQVETIIEELVNGDYCKFSDNGKSVVITERGHHYMASRLTDDFDEEWQQWWGEFQHHFNRIPYKYIDDNWNQYIHLFSKNLSPEQAAYELQWGSCYKEAHEEVKFAIKAQLDLNIDELSNKRIILFAPSVFLTPELISLPVTDIQFDIEAPSWAIPDSSFKTKRFWPNKRYVAPYLRNTPSYKGWYAVIPDDLETDVTYFEITYCWSSKSGAFKTIRHSMAYHLQKNSKSPIDWLYGNASPSDEYSFNSVYCLTHGKPISQDEMLELDRIQSGIRSLEINKSHVLIEEERYLIASNSYECVYILT
ncbi:hypothetical protein [Vibrio algicola]|uniref:hypothetical protein n=1 Tax=Vibrio algicola TaxID=2662262 RepID=UPI0015B4C2B9|nr:hypothetical protein [Vibrio algicola]